MQPESRVEPSSYWQKTSSPQTLSAPLPSGADVAIIGGGLLGAAACYWVARTGCSVVLLEQTALAAGATGRNGGFVSIGPTEAYAQAIARLGHEIARAVLEVTLANRALMRQVLAEEAIACDYREPGHLHLLLEEEQVRLSLQNSLALQHDGVPSLVLERAHLQEFLPSPLSPQILGASFLPQMGLVHSVMLVQGVVAAAQRSGAQAVATTVLHLSADGEGICVHTTNGRLRAGKVIVAVNAWLPELLPSLKPVITPVRGQMLASHPLPPLFPTGVTVELGGSETYWQQAPDGTILLGGCRSAAEGHDVGIRGSQPTPAVQHALEQVFPHLFPQLPELPVAQRWAGPMAFTPDFLPVVDLAPEVPHTWVVGGFSGHGMPFGFRLGQLLAEAVTTRRVPPELLPFQLHRPTLKEGTNVEQR